MKTIQDRREVIKMNKQMTESFILTLVCGIILGLSIYSAYHIFFVPEALISFGGGIVLIVIGTIIGVVIGGIGTVVNLLSMNEARDD